MSLLNTNVNTMGAMGMSSFFHDVADDAENKHDANIPEAVIDGICP